MGFVVLLFGFLILLVGVAIFVKPGPFFDLIRRHSESLGLHALAIAVRLILGIALITYADDSRYSVAFQIIGGLSVAAAIILTLIGRSRFKRLVSWGLNQVSSFGRITGVLATLLGGFLIYAVL